MKNFLEYLVIVFVFILITISVTYGIRTFSAVSTPINLVSPKQGVTCATMVTSDGAAISCWKD